MGKRGRSRKRKGSGGEFERKMGTEIRRQEKLDRMEEKDFRRGELPGKYTVKTLYGWDDEKFEEEYLRKLERNLL